MPAANPNATIAGTHCESCGATDAESLHGDDGYTSCCNECCCDGGYRNRFGIPSNYVTACCWAVATLRFGGDENVPDGSSRLD